MESSPTEHAFPGDPPQPRQLPPDLPTSLDDRREPRNREEMEVYDAWQGEWTLQLPILGPRIVEAGADMLHRAITVSYHAGTRTTPQLQPVPRRSELWR
jgi:hypothetical protein